MDYYEILGIPRNAPLSEISESYRNLARKHHPDMHQDEQAKNENAVIFKKIAEAYSVLSDPAKRSQYDIQGYVGRRPPQRPARPKPATKTKEDFERERAEAQDHNEKNEFDREPMNVSCTFFGGGSTGRNIMVHLKLEPKEMQNGCEKWVVIKKRVACRRCVGDGWALWYCPKCRTNSGKKRDPYGVGWCNHCENTGTIGGDCELCQGIGLGKWEISQIKVIVPRNTKPGHTITIMGEGEIAPKKPPGNIRVVVV